MTTGSHCTPVHCVCQDPFLRFPCIVGRNRINLIRQGWQSTAPATIRESTHASKRMQVKSHNSTEIKLGSDSISENVFLLLFGLGATGLFVWTFFTTETALFSKDGLLGLFLIASGCMMVVGGLFRPIKTWTFSKHANKLKNIGKLKVYETDDYQGQWGYEGIKDGDFMGLELNDTVLFLWKMKGLPLHVHTYYDLEGKLVKVSVSESRLFRH